MTKTRKFRLVRLGDAKRLTQGGTKSSVEFDQRPQLTAG